MGFSWDTIFGARVGFEFIPPHIAEVHEAVYGVLFDLLFIRIILWRLIPEE